MQYYTTTILTDISQEHQLSYNYIQYFELKPAPVVINKISTGAKNVITRLAAGNGNVTPLWRHLVNK